MKTYSKVSDSVERSIERMREEHHDYLADVTIGALFIFDDEGTEPVLKHGGYPAAAYVRITPLRDRAAGLPDAMIVIDRAYWMTLGSAVCDALMDHELTHLERVVDKETGAPVSDIIGRPKLAIRRHDRQHGWFDEVARRHRENSIEVRQARALIAETEQLYFDFASPVTSRPAAATAPRSAH
jgi:hypothetical protein